jgi:hypothetical protein
MRVASGAIGAGDVWTGESSLGLMAGVMRAAARGMTELEAEIPLPRPRTAAAAAAKNALACLPLAILAPRPLDPAGLGRAADLGEPPGVAV